MSPRSRLRLLRGPPGAAPPDPQPPPGHPDPAACPGSGKGLRFARPPAAAPPAPLPPPAQAGHRLSSRARGSASLSTPTVRQACLRGSRSKRGGAIPEESRGEDAEEKNWGLRSLDRPMCRVCQEPLSLWTVEVHDGYPCWRCKQPMRILLVFRKGRRSDGFRPLESELAYNKPESLVPFAAKYGVRLERRYSQALGDRYIMHICPHCGAPQSDSRIAEDLHEETHVLERVDAVSCRTCRYWREVDAQGGL